MKKIILGLIVGFLIGICFVSADEGSPASYSCNDNADNDGDGYADLGGCDIDSDGYIDYVCGNVYASSESLLYTEVISSADSCEGSWHPTFDAVWPYSGGVCGPGEDIDGVIIDRDEDCVCTSDNDCSGLVCDVNTGDCVACVDSDETSSVDVEFVFGKTSGFAFDTLTSGVFEDSCYDSGNVLEYSCLSTSIIGKEYVISRVITCDPGYLCSDGICVRLIEVCNNKIDDDLDGKIDCKDSDCTSDSSCTLKGRTRLFRAGETEESFFLRLWDFIIFWN